MNFVGLSRIQKEIFNIVNKNCEDGNIAIGVIYNLLLAFEMSLKAYLIYLNPEYENEAKLKKLGHNLVIIKEKIILQKDNTFLDINNLFVKHEILSQDTNEIRYPYVGKELFISDSLYVDVITFIEKVEILINK